MEQAMNRKQRFKGQGIDPTNESDVAYSLARTRDVRNNPRGRYRENNQVRARARTHTYRRMHMVLILYNPPFS